MTLSAKRRVATGRTSSLMLTAPRRYRWDSTLSSVALGTPDSHLRRFYLRTPMRLRWRGRSLRVKRRSRSGPTARHQPEIASYPPTTSVPTLARVDGGDHDYFPSSHCSVGVAYPDSGAGWFFWIW